MHPAYFYLTALIAIVTTSMVIISRNAVHALLNLIVSLLAVAVIFYQLGASFAAVLEVIVYAGAIMILMIFVIMMLNQGDVAVHQESQWLQAKNWITPGILAAILLGQLLLMFGGLSGSDAADENNRMYYVGPKAVGLALFSQYVLAVELASMLLLSGLIGAFHLARRNSIDDDTIENKNEH